MDMKKQNVKKAFVDTIPVLTGYIVLGIGFGMILKSKGFGLIWAVLMSVFIYAGSMQYVAIDLLSGGVGLITTALTTLMVNARHLFYGISMVEKYKGLGNAKPYAIFALTDETYSLVCNKDENTPKSYYVLVSLFNQIYWITGSVIGSILGTVIKINTTGMDFALTALFVTVFVEQWLQNKNHCSAVIGVLSTVLCLIIFGSDNFLIPSMVLITLLLTLFKKFLTDREKSNE